jgi:hypothetical protein
LPFGSFVVLAYGLFNILPCTSIKVATMRHGRAKQARKTLQFFARITNNRIRPPYSILLDGTFLVAMIQFKLHDEMTSRLHRLLQQHEHHGGDHGSSSSSQMIQLMTTRSTLIELQKLEQAVSVSSSNKTTADSSENKALVFRQARVWAETNCMRILESEDIPDESSSTMFDISSIPTTPSSVMQQGKNYKNSNNKRARGGCIADVSLVGREFLRLTMAVLVQEEADDEAKKEKSTTAATLDDAPSNTKDGEESGSSSKEEDSSGNSRREQGGQWRQDGKRRSSHQHQYRHGYYFVASQDEQVLDRLRHLGHVPIIRLARGSVLLLEQPSKAATQQAWREERVKWRLGVGSGTGTSAAGAGSATGNSNGAAVTSMLQQERSEAQRLVQEERQERRQREQQQQQKHQPYAARQKKRAKGPNPLSCKPGAKKKQKT